MNLKKINIFILSIFLIFAATSCSKKENFKDVHDIKKVDNSSSNSNIKEEEKEEVEVDYSEFSDVETGREKAKKIIKCFNENDKNTLKSMFTGKLQKREELDEEIDRAMEFFDGKVIDDDWSVFEVDRNVDEEIIKVIRADPFVYSLKTDKGKIYSLYGNTIVVNERNIDDVGLIGLIVYETDDGKLPDYNEDAKVIIGNIEIY